MSELTHIDSQGNARMVEVGDKQPTARQAVAEGFIQLGKPAFDAITHGRVKKGDVLAIAQLAGIAAAKRTSDLIPLCHPVPLTGVKVELQALPDQRIRAWARVRCTWVTGVARPDDRLVRAPIGENNLGDFWFFSQNFIVCFGVFWEDIIPKWLIKVPGHIPILFG